MSAPSIGRIVHLTTSAGETVPAIIAGLTDSDSVILTVFPPRKLPGYIVDPVRFSESPKPGHWNWPPRA